MLMEACDIKQNLTASPEFIDIATGDLLDRSQMCMQSDPMVILGTLVSEFPFWQLIERALLENEFFFGCAVEISCAEKRRKH